MSAEQHTLGTASDSPALSPAVASEQRTLSNILSRPSEDQTVASSLGSANGVVSAATIPGYEILDELGRGGMGVVYQARHVKLNRLVALKTILAGSHAGDAELARFQTEAEAIARLQHPNIVQVYEVGEHEGKPFFSLEFCGGGSLEKKLNGTPLPAREAAALVETLARAMQAAHAQHIIHRDLKPANVLLTDEGVPKITDFGLAKKLDEAGQTHSGAIMGTPSYMAPEQAGGKSSAIGPLVDVYALGAILYECLTGRPPFKAATALDTILQVASDEPVAPSQLQTKTPRDLETICLKCLEKERAKRYSTAAALAEDLRRFLDGKPIAARPLSLGERFAKWARRRPAVAVLLGSLATVVLLALIGLTTLLWRLHGETQAARAAEQHADVARRESDRMRGVAEGALAESQNQRLTLNCIAYPQLCVAASHLANLADWEEGKVSREKFEQLSYWMRLVSGPDVQQALQSYLAILKQWHAGRPPPELQRATLRLAYACRDSWLTTVEMEQPELAEQFRTQLYARACSAVERLAAAPRGEDIASIRQEFWELYWGELPFVESSEVSRVMVRVGNLLKQWEPGQRVPNELALLAKELRVVCAARSPR